MNEPVLEVNDLCLRIHDKPILIDVGFSICAGETMGLIGESGSGKSMTAYSILQLLPEGSDCSGSIMLGKKELNGLTDEQLCNIRGDDIGMIFQEPMTALNPVQTIGQQVAETVLVHQSALRDSGRNRSVSRQEAVQIARETLARVGLPENEVPMSKYPHQLSGGQRQRVVIAMAVALRPRLLIADEPTTALDVTTQAQILDMLKKLVSEDGMAMLLISHDLAVVSSVADHLAIMKSGRVLEAGPCSQVLREKEHPYTRELLKASSHVPEREEHVSVSDQPLLQVSNLVRDYPLSRVTLFGGVRKFRAVDNVSFQIARGENVGLVGESGCGKSTLTRAILGLDTIQGGSITISGEAVLAGGSMGRHLRRQMQVVFQDPYGSFNPRHKVRRLVAEPFHLLDSPPKGQSLDRAVDEVLESVGLVTQDADKYIHEFSGGQRQRVAIARALIIRPSLIILDEAVSALDVSIRARILDLLASIGDQYDLSYLFISHDLSVVRSITDRVLVMKNGVIVEQGETEQVFTKPHHAYTKELIAAIPVLELGDDLSRQEK